MIVLGTTKVGESSVVLHAVSKEYGRRSFIVQAGRKVPASLLLPLNVLEAEIIENPKSDLWRAKNLLQVFPLEGVRSNIYKNTMTLFMSEVLFRLLHDDTFDPGLYDWCRKSVLILDSIESDFSNYHLRFLLELAVAMGFQPSAEALAPFAGEHFDELKAFVSLPFAESMLLPLSGERRNAIAEVLLRYISVHAECSLNVRSLKVLRELYV